MRISDWSSDVCSSDLLAGLPPPPAPNPMSHEQHARERDAILARGERIFLGARRSEFAVELRGGVLRGIGLGIGARFGVDRGAAARVGQIGRAHVCTPVTNAHLVCRLMLEKTNNNKTSPPSHRSHQRYHNN